MHLAFLSRLGQDVIEEKELCFARKEDSHAI